MKVWGTKLLLVKINFRNQNEQINFFRYGREMGSATENALSTVGNSYLTAYNAAALGPKSLAKRAAKTTGLYF